MLLNSLGMRTKQLQNKWGRDKAKNWPCWERSAKRSCQDQTQRKEDWQPGMRDLERIIGLGYNEDAEIIVGSHVKEREKQAYRNRAQLSMMIQMWKILKRKGD